MSSSAISVENLSKAYRIGTKEEVPDTLMGAAKGIFTAPWKNFQALRRLNTTASTPTAPLPSSPAPSQPHGPTPPLPHSAAASSDPETLWALRDVSFEINEGDVVGIVGRNGAGKSTLLKVLSRITEPTSGRVVIRGRVSSLLEVGTGFHPELTGRENVYMNGTILGMRKKEIDRKFDEIVDFSGVEKFLDTPTKRYSSGMQVRLAFAVAAHLEPEILIVDEVLAVGDADFQGKCLGKMKSVADGGRTVLFVSHNMDAVATLTRNSIFLEHGAMVANDSTDRVLDCYLQKSRQEARAEWIAPSASEKPFALRYCSVDHLTGAANNQFRFGAPVSFRADWKVPPGVDLGSIDVAIRLTDGNGRAVTSLNSRGNAVLRLDKKGCLSTTCVMYDNCLSPNKYFADLAIYRKGVGDLCVVENCVSFTVTDIPESAGYRFNISRKYPVAIKSQWNCEPIANEKCSKTPV